MDLLHSFPPLARPDARILILGSMPGVASLDAGQYYAHPRNAFWPIMATLTGCAATQPYAQRTHALLDAGIAVWDVLAACERAGSLDTAIAPASMQANDFAGFFRAHPQIRHVFFNGGLAEQSFRRLVLKPMQTAAAEPPFTCHFLRLPSTSPAHAGRSLAEKQRVWIEALGKALQSRRG